MLSLVGKPAAGARGDCGNTAPRQAGQQSPSLPGRAPLRLFLPEASAAGPAAHWLPALPSPRWVPGQRLPAARSGLEGGGGCQADLAAHLAGDCCTEAQLHMVARVKSPWCNPRPQLGRKGPLTPTVGIR